MKFNLANLFIIIFLQFICLNSVYAQENFIPGCIVNQNGDTLKGFINYRNWNINPTSVQFKNNENESALNYGPLEIKSFNVLDEVYISAVLNVNSSSTKIEELSDSANFSFRTDTVFLQAMLQGSKSLYYYKDKFENDHFFISLNSEFQELLYKRYIRSENSTSNILENKRYVAQLSLYLADCTTIRSKLSGLGYKKSDLFNLFKYYYHCTNSTTNFEKKVDKLKVEAGIKAGLAISKLIFKSNYFDYLIYPNYPKKTTFAGGFFVNIVIPRTNKKSSIYNEFLFTTYKTIGTYNKYLNGVWDRDLITEIGYSYIKINTLFEYKYPVKNLSILFNIGMSNSFGRAIANYKTETYLHYHDTIVEHGKALSDARNYEQGLVIGLGGQIKKYSFELRFEKSNGMSKFAALTSVVNRSYFLFGYTF